MAQRSITKLAFADGTETFTATWPATNAAHHGAWENAELTKDGTAVILAGLTNGPFGNDGYFNFKSCMCARDPTALLLACAPA